MLQPHVSAGWMACVGYGLRAARHHWRLVAGLWLLLVTSASLASAPASRWLHDALASSPAADVLRERFDLILVMEALRDTAGGFSPIVLTPLFGVIVLMLVINPFVAGGTLTVVSWPDRAPGRFFDGGRMFYWRFVKLFAVVIAGAAILTTGGVLLTTLLFSTAWDAGRETLAWGIAAAAAGLGVGLWIACILALDYARIHVVCLDSQRMIHAWRAALQFIIGHLWSVLALALTFGVVTFALVLLSHPLDLVWPASNGVWIALGLILHQAIAFARVWLRVAWLSAALHLTRARDSFDPTLIA